MGARQFHATRQLQTLSQHVDFQANDGGQLRKRFRARVQYTQAQCNPLSAFAVAGWGKHFVAPALGRNAKPSTPNTGW
jgi:hypothetical protein